MKRTLLSTAILIGISGSALASNDQLMINMTAHPHEDSKTTERVIWTDSKDTTHSYELHIDGDQITVIVDGKEVPTDQINTKNNGITILNKDGSVQYEFLNMPFSTKKNQMFVVADSNNTKNLHLKGHLKAHVNAQADQDEKPRKVMLGINLSDANEQLLNQYGIDVASVLVERVIKGLPADQSGIQDRDIIISIDGSNGMSSKQLTEFLQKQNPGDEIQIVVVRNGEKVQINTALQSYNAEALGSDAVQIEHFWSPIEGSSDGSSAPFIVLGTKNSNQIRNQTHEKIMGVLRNSGISEDQILKIEVQIDESLDGFVKSVQGIVKTQNDTDTHIKGRVMMAENMRKKAEQAMQDIEDRLTLQYKDGQLLLKRHTDNLRENKFPVLRERLHESMPAIESQLDDRLGELENRLNELEDVLDSRMENLTTLIERLIDRLDEE